MFRRRPLARAAVVGGAAYYGGKRHAEGQAREADQQARLDDLEQQQYQQAPPPAAAAPQEDPMEKLKELGALHDQGILTDTEFEIQKQKILQAMYVPNREERRHMSIGPVQMLILGFDDPKFTGEGLKELDRLRDADIVRLVDLLAVYKDAEGDVSVLQETQLSEDEAKEFGAVVGGLIGLGMAGEEGLEAGAEAGAEALEDQHVLDADNVWYATDAIPNNTAAVIALLEHRWAIPLRAIIAEAGGFVLADEWIHAKDLVAVGLAAAEEASAQS